MNKAIFVPFSEDLVEKLDFTLGDLVPFSLDYDCIRLLDSRGKNQKTEKPKKDG